MVLRSSPLLQSAVRLVSPGQPLRDGLDRILRAKTGALVVVGDGPDVLAICSGGFLLDAEYSPQRLSELAKMDGAIIFRPMPRVSLAPTCTSSLIRALPPSRPVPGIAPPSGLLVQSMCP